MIRKQKLNESTLSEITYSPDDSKVLHRLRDYIFKAQQGCYNTRNEDTLENIFHIVNSLDSISSLSDKYEKGKVSVSFFEKAYKHNCETIKKCCNKIINVINEDLDASFTEESIDELDDYAESVTRRNIRSNYKLR